MRYRCRACGTEFDGRGDLEDHLEEKGFTLWSIAGRALWEEIFDGETMILLKLTPEEATALYQASCGYKVREPARKEALQSSLRKIIDAGFAAGFSVVPDLTEEP